MEILFILTAMAIALMPTITCIFLGGIYTALGILSLIPWLTAIFWTWQAYHQWKNEKQEDDYV